MGTLYQKFSPCNNPRTSKGKVILIPAAAEIESAAKISTIATSKLNYLLKLAILLPKGFQKMSRKDAKAQSNLLAPLRLCALEIQNFFILSKSPIFDIPLLNVVDDAGDRNKLQFLQVKVFG
jgi:hypothetical protein